MSINDPLIGTTLGDYTIQELLGRGGMARVYRGYDENLDRYAAVKVIEPNLVAGSDEAEYRERFLREARAIARLNHPRVVGVFQFAQRDNLYYMAMVYVNGQDLRHILKEHVQQGTYMGHARVLNIIRDIAEALDYAHEQGVIHRDVKPSNIMVMEDGHAVLTDFGLALSAHEGTVGNTFGSVHYIAPEQAVSSAQASPQSDLYSLGVVLYEMLTGRVPFEDASAMSVALKHISDPPPRPSMLNDAITPELEEVIAKALHKDPQKRFRTGMALIHALEGAFAASDEEDTHEMSSSWDDWDVDEPATGTSGEVDQSATGTQSSRVSRPSRPSRGSSPMPPAEEIDDEPFEGDTEALPKRRSRVGTYLALLLLVALIGGGALFASGQVNFPVIGADSQGPSQMAGAELTPENGDTTPTAQTREGEASEQSLPPVNAELITEPRILLQYDWEQVVIYNRSPDTTRVDVRRLSFYDPDTQVIFSEEDWQYRDPRWLMRPQTDCFQVLDGQFNQRSTPDFCRFLQAFQPVPEPFWSSTNTSDTFEVRWEGEPVTKCRTVRKDSDDLQRCLVDIPDDDDA